MKDLVEFRFTIATRELSGKAVVALTKTLGKGLKKIEPQLMRLIEKSTQVLEKGLDDEMKETKESK